MDSPHFFFQELDSSGGVSDDGSVHVLQTLAETGEDAHEIVSEGEDRSVSNR